jgi:hypothetical protein
MGDQGLEPYFRTFHDSKELAQALKVPEKVLRFVELKKDVTCRKNGCPYPAAKEIMDIAPVALRNGIL